VIKGLTRRFVAINLAVLVVVFALMAAVILAGQPGPVVAVHRWVIVGVVAIGLAAGVSVVISRHAVRPVKAAWQRQLDFTADASHELRTPLAVIQTNLELVLGHPDETVASQMVWLENILADVHRMGTLVGDLLTLSRADTGEQVLAEDVVALDEAVARVAASFGPVAQAAGVAIATTLAPVAVRGDAERLGQLATILVDNAVKHMGRAGTVNVTLTADETGARLTVADDGQGIPAADLPHVFDRFYRASASRSTEGSGLGLAIAQWIARAHGGDIAVASEEGKGTSFTVRLPGHGRARVTRV
jgi:signal transduction histidine kinase